MDDKTPTLGFLDIGLFARSYESQLRRASLILIGDRTDGISIIWPYIAFWIDWTREKLLIMSLKTNPTIVV